jgi:hypothetical protein
MRCIRSLQSPPRFHTLRDFDDGTTVRLQARLAANMEPDDPILLVNMQSYTLFARHNNGSDHQAQYEGKRVILNLATGRLSCVDAGRKCTEIQSEVHTS